MSSQKFQNLVVTLIFLFSIILGMAVPEAIFNVGAAGAPEDKPGGTSYGGNWNINAYTYRGNQTIILDGNLTIESGGKLVFRNVILKMNSTANGTFSIRVEDGGQFYIYDNSIITSNHTDGKHRYLFWVEPNGTLTVKNSAIRECGYGNQTGTNTSFRKDGLYIERGYADIASTVFSNCSFGLILDRISDNKSVLFDNLQFHNCYYGLYSLGNNTRIRSSTFRDVNNSIYINGTNNTISECIIYNASHNAVYIEGGTARVYESEIYRAGNGLVFLDDFSTVPNSSIEVNLTTIWHISDHTLLLNGRTINVYNSTCFNISNGLRVTRTDADVDVNNTRFYNCVQTGVFMGADNATVTNTTITWGITGIIFDGTNSTGGYNTINNCTYGINITEDNINIQHTVLKGNNWSFAPIDNLVNITLMNNTIYKSKNGTLEFYGSSFSKITDNRIAENVYGLVLNNTYDIQVINNTLTDNTFGLDLIKTNYAGIYDNDIGQNVFGLRLAGENTTIIGNTFNNTNYDLNLTGNNRITTSVYHNNFYNQIIAPENSSIWGLGYPEGGNYYHFSNLTDLNCTEGQNISGPDGLMDNPYIFNTSYNDKDTYPLAVPWPINHLPHADNFTFEVNVSVKPMAVMFIANGSDLEDNESALTPVFEYLAPNGTWENDSVSMLRYINGTWLGNLTHPLNGSKGWYDIRVRFRDSGGYHSNVIYLNQTFNITTEKPYAIGFNITTYLVNRTRTIRMQLNGTDPDESEFNLTPHLEIRLKSNTTWIPINYWDVNYVFVNFSGNDTGNYTKGYWYLNYTPDIDVPAGSYDIRFRFNDTDFDFSDWFYHNKSLAIQNNAPVMDTFTIPAAVLNRTHTIVITADAIDIENDLANLTAVMQYRAPSGIWTDLINETYNASLNKWTGEFTPNVTYELGDYDFRVEFYDLDNDTTGWKQVENVLDVVNNAPVILNMIISKESVYRTEWLYIYINGIDIETNESSLVPRLQYRSPTGDWTNLTALEYKNSRWRANFTLTADAELGFYDFRAWFLDVELLPGVSGEVNLSNVLEVQNNRPVTTGFDIEPARIFRGEKTKVYFSGSDIEDAKNELQMEISYRVNDPFDKEWILLGYGTYSSTGDRWSIEFIPPNTAELGWYDLSARLYDQDDGSSNIYEAVKSLFVMNNVPTIHSLTFSTDTAYRLDMVTIWLNSSDIEDTPDKFIKYLHMQKPDSTEWDALEGNWELVKPNVLQTRVFFNLEWPIGSYDFRAIVHDTNGNESGWLVKEGAVNILNKPPILYDATVTPINGSISTIFNFTVRYVESEIELPSKRELHIDSEIYTPVELDPSDIDPVDGKLYYYATKLPVGEYSFHFEFWDAAGGYAESTIFFGLKVENITKVPDPGEIQGRIIDDFSKNGIPQASIFYSPSYSNFIKIRADSTGQFRIIGLAAGNYNLYVTASGYKTSAIKDIDVYLEKTSYINFTLTREVSPDAEEYDVELTVTKKELALNENFTLEAVVTDSDGEPVDDDDGLIYSWDFGDGSELSWGKTQVHYYSTPGNYNVTLSVFDDLGIIDIKLISVTVNETEYILDEKPDGDDDGTKEKPKDEESSMKGLYTGLTVITLIIIIILVVIFFMLYRKGKPREKPEEEPEPAEEPKDEAAVEEPAVGMAGEEVLSEETKEVAEVSEPSAEVPEAEEEPDVEIKITEIDDEEVGDEHIEEVEEEGDVKLIIEEYKDKK